MLDLKKNQYSTFTLKKNIYQISLIDILKTQYIDIDFAVKYILQKKYQLTEEEQQITPKLVLYFQPHLLEKDLFIKIEEYDSDNDSFLFE